MKPKNKLYYGDNLYVLREYIPDESVNLIYLDPPFNSNRNYNVLFAEENGQDSEAQIKAFDDTWHWDKSAVESYNEIVKNTPHKVSKMIQALREFIGENQMMSYLVMMTIRLVELHRVLKPTGSIYLHCDPTASHYLKIILDTIFEHKNFQNEIVWCYKTGGATKIRFGRKHDIIFFYSKSQKWYFNPIKEKSYMMHHYGFKKSDFKIDELGQYSMVIAKDWWEIPAVGSATSERLGYPTQKPLDLLKKIIIAASKEGDIVLDPFCGCGTAVAAAQKLNRKWIGIDITHLAISLQKYRLNDMFSLISDSDYDVIGEPEDLESAKALALQGRYQFEWWAISKVHAKPVNGQQGSKKGKKGSDRGIDGITTFEELENGKLTFKNVLIQVKSGHVKSGDIRDFRGTIERENAPIGVFITLENPTKPMNKEALSAGNYTSEAWGKDYPRIQILTIEQLFNGEKIKMPEDLPQFKKAKRVSNSKKENGLFEK